MESHLGQLENLTNTAGPGAKEYSTLEAKEWRNLRQTVSGVLNKADRLYYDRGLPPPNNEYLAKMIHDVLKEAFPNLFFNTYLWENSYGQGRGKTDFSFKLLKLKENAEKGDEKARMDDLINISCQNAHMIEESKATGGAVMSQTRIEVAQSGKQYAVFWTPRFIYKDLWGETVRSFVAKCTQNMAVRGHIEDNGSSFCEGIARCIAAVSARLPLRPRAVLVVQLGSIAAWSDGFINSFSSKPYILQPGENFPASSVPLVHIIVQPRIQGP